MCMGRCDVGEKETDNTLNFRCRAFHTEYKTDFVYVISSFLMFKINQYIDTIWLWIRSLPMRPSTPKHTAIANIDIGSCDCTIQSLIWRHMSCFTMKSIACWVFRPTPSQCTHFEYERCFLFNISFHTLFIRCHSHTIRKSCKQYNRAHTSKVKRLNSPVLEPHIHTHTKSITNVLFRTFNSNSLHSLRTFCAVNAYVRDTCNPWA